MKVARTSALYFGFQGLLIFAWWGMLLLVPESRRSFLIDPNSETSLMSFWLADIGMLGFGSLVTACLCARHSEYRTISAWFVTRAVAYPTIYCTTLAIMTDVGWLGVILMFPAMTWSGAFSVGMTFSKGMFRPSKESSANWIIFKTFTQIIVVWSIILVIFPYLITIVEGKLGIARLSFPFQHLLAIVLFAIISLLGVYAAYVMSKVGKGTPLPLDHARNLVVIGPYRYVRNPMAVSGIGQGCAVALYLGSPLVLLYALMGSLIWQLIFRPLEEDNLIERFGNEYTDYSSDVKCWIPRMRPYQRY